MPYKNTPIPQRVGNFFKKHHLTPIKYIGTDKHHKHIFIWKCECGKEKQARYNNVTYGKTFSCGCKKAKWNSKRFRKEIKELAVNKYITGMKRKERGKKFTLERSEIENLLFKKCFYCNSLPSNEYKSSYGGKIKYNGIDRVDNSKGYEKGNVVSCCRTCNVMKSTMPLIEFREHLLKLYKNFVKEV